MLAPAAGAVQCTSVKSSQQTQCCLQIQTLSNLLVAAEASMMQIIACTAAVLRPLSTPDVAVLLLSAILSTVRLAHCCKHVHDAAGSIHYSHVESSRLSWSCCPDAACSFKIVMLEPAASAIQCSGAEPTSNPDAAVMLLHADSNTCHACYWCLQTSKLPGVKA